MARVAPCPAVSTVTFPLVLSLYKFITSPAFNCNIHDPKSSLEIVRGWSRVEMLLLIEKIHFL